ncbi:hypothetical protein AB1285_18710 [Microbacterium sp. NRRL B-14842]|uniref:hypothetical protein n=1 Tax=Microbacterium sp. NRRL B-14842 TaxID=3162881 RepID=UPI003D2BC67A
MSRGFSLAGLLRVREIQERAAAQRSRARSSTRSTPRPGTGPARTPGRYRHGGRRRAHPRCARRGPGLRAALLADLTALADLQQETVAEARSATRTPGARSAASNDSRTTTR